MQLSFQVFRPEREAKYEYKCNVSVNAETHAKLSFLPLVRTNHQPLFDVLHHLPLHLTPLVSVTAPQTVLRSIASFASNCCSTLPNNLLLQKVKPVYNVSHLSPLHSLPQTWVIKHFLHCWRDVIASFASYWCSTLLNNQLLQKAKPVHNVSQLFISSQLESTHFWYYKGTYQQLAKVDTVDMSPRLLEAATSL